MCTCTVRGRVNHLFSPASHPLVQNNGLWEPLNTLLSLGLHLPLPSAPGPAKVPAPCSPLLFVLLPGSWLHNEIAAAVMSFRVLRGKQLNERNAPFFDKTVVRYCSNRDSVVSFFGNCTPRKGSGGTENLMFP